MTYLRRVIDKFAFIFSYPNNSGMQDWEYEVADFTDIEEYFYLYPLCRKPEEKQMLSKMIIEALEDYSGDIKLVQHKYTKLKAILISDFEILEEVIDYWCDWDNGDELELCWDITPFMRNVFDFGKANLVLSET